MKAVVIDDFGGPEVLHLADVDMPEPGHGQVRIRVRAAGVNPVDTGIRLGHTRSPTPTPLPAILGIDVAGVIDAIGDGVSGLAVGEEVFGWADAPAGSYAEYALATKVARKPAELSFDHAATLPVAGDAAKRGLDLLGVRAGDTVLIHGAAGSVGTLAVQLARARGATVIGTASQANQDYVSTLGAIPTVYGQGLVDRVHALTARVDAVLDAAGKGALPDSIELAGGTERVATLADPNAESLGVRFVHGDPKVRSAADLAEWAELAARGDLITTVAGTYPLDHAADAHRVSEAGHNRGKLVLTVDPDPARA